MAKTIVEKEEIKNVNIDKPTEEKKKTTSRKTATKAVNKNVKEEKTVAKTQSKDTKSTKAKKTTRKKTTESPKAKEGRQENSLTSEKTKKKITTTAKINGNAIDNDTKKENAVEKRSETAELKITKESIEQLKEKINLHEKIRKLENEIISKQEAIKKLENEIILNKQEINKIQNLEEDSENKEAEQKQTNKKKNKNGISILKKILIVILILGIIGISTAIFLFYGPYKGFRDWWITTAMTTMRHQYLATWFFNKETIEEVLSKNRVEEVDGITDTTLIVPIENNKDEITYKNKYEKQILAKGLNKEEYDIYEDTEDYRIVKIEGKKYSGYLAVIYDPSRVQAVASKDIGKSGQYLTTMVQENDAILGINGGGFLDEGYNGNGSTPHGITITKGKVISANKYSGVGGLIGFDNDNRLVLGKMNLTQARAMNIRDAVTWGPYLIINGEKSQVLGNGGWGTAPRTAIGQRQDGIVLMLVIDGRRATKPGADMNELIEIMERYGAYNAVNLDGGTSSAMVVGNKIINDPIDASGAHRTRYIATGFILTKKVED
ncbi:MAG: hypothetical protein HFJ47_04495 [Clostridia bacterium]|nr:hypothetical protein [Clostridia bacterium]